MRESGPGAGPMWTGMRRRFADIGRSITKYQNSSRRGAVDNGVFGNHRGGAAAVWATFR
jgi:hypothetical protein